jgi:hypothetical protein
LFCVLLIAVAACDRQAPPPRALPAANCAPLPSAIPNLPANSTSLRTEPAPSPRAALELSIVSPALGELVTAADPGAYPVRLALSGALDDVSGIEVTLDAGRPRRLAHGRSAVSLNELLPADSALSQGTHWLFAAPVSASGLVPRRASDGLRVALGRRFFVGQVPSAEAGPSGAVWLRTPEGTYNGARKADRVLFDAYAFSATGALLDAPCTVLLRGPGASGEMRLMSPFFALELASGEYEATLSSASAAPSSTRFTVNRELGGGP